jgi:hypothetical protein
MIEVGVDKFINEFLSMCSKNEILKKLIESFDENKFHKHWKIMFEFLFSR